MSEPRILKQFEEVSCPHCKKNFFIGSQSMVSSITSTPTREEIEDAKKDVISRLEEIEFIDKSEKENIIKYLKNEETLIDFSDVEPMLKQIAMDQIEKKKQNNDK